MGVYQQLYDLIMQYLFANEVTTNSDLVCMILSTYFSVLVIVIPLMVIWAMICFIFRFFVRD